MKTTKMRKLSIKLFYFFLVASCATKFVLLKKHEYELGQYAKLNIQSFKQSDDKLEISLLGISTELEAIGFKKNEILCGVGNDIYSDVSVKGTSDDFVIMPKTTFIEFRIICKQEIPLKDQGMPFLIFKNLYAFKKDGLDKIMSSDLKIELN
jgi:hypothetical protein